MISISRPKIERIIVRPGSTATVVSKPRGNGVRVVQSAAPAPGDIQMTDLLAAYTLSKS